jgi:hypothetical protein
LIPNIPGLSNSRVELNWIGAMSKGTCRSPLFSSSASQRFCTMQIILGFFVQTMCCALVSTGRPRGVVTRLAMAAYQVLSGVTNALPGANNAAHAYGR